MSRFSRRACAYGGGRRGLRRQGGQATAYDFSRYSVPEMHLHDDAADITVTGSGVSAWVDKTGTHTISQATDADRPAFSGNSGDGVVFDVANTEALDVTSPELNSPWLYLFVDLDIGSTGTIRYLLDHNGTNRGLFALGGTSDLMGYFDGTSFRNITIATTGRQTLVWELDFTGGNLEMWRNGTSVGTNNAVTNTPNIGGGTSRISESATTAAGYCDMTLYRMIVYGRDSQFTAAQRSEIEENL